jgi:DNA invertase Pin-like site-specific DNA recombinase
METVRPEAERPGLRAAQYLRMSTEHQRYSTEQQAATIAAYAAARGYEIIQTYTDHGVSGLELKKRKALQQLLADVIGGAEYQVILVYDVSRWGRFQNPDQSAHYEFLCSEAGVPVEYCAEPFANDGSMASSILKSLKRAMAAEFSRELSVKVSNGQKRLAAKGYWQGGPAGLGLRRQVVDEHGRPREILERGQHKAIHGHRTILVPGPPEELALVRRIFHLFVRHGMSRKAIVRLLNAEGRRSENGAHWSWTRLNSILNNPIYVGDLVFNRSRSTLGGPKIQIPPSAWTRLDGVFEPVIDRQVFDAAQQRMAAGARRRTRDDIKASLERLLAEKGFLSHSLIQQTPGAPKADTICRKFGTLEAAFAAAGFVNPEPDRAFRPGYTNDALLDHLAALLKAHGYLSRKLINGQKGKPVTDTYRNRFGSLAAAYALVGYVWMGTKQKTGPVGRARQAAAVAQSIRQAD